MVQGKYSIVEVKFTPKITKLRNDHTILKLIPAVYY